MSPIRPPGGYAMLDALVAMLLLGFGAIVCARALLDGSRASREARLHAEAALLAADMAELAAFGDVPVFDTATAAPVVASCLGPGIACSRAAWLAFEAQDWRRRVLAAMPAGRAVVCRDAMPWSGGYRWECLAAAGAPYVVKLGWDADRAPRVVVQL